MSPPAEASPRRSLLGRHLRILGYEPGTLDAGDHEEARRLRALPLPPLHLAERPRRRLSPQVWALAASLVVTMLAWWQLLPEEHAGDRLRSKGASKVWVFWERGGVVSPWSQDVALRNGDRVRTEVLAGEAAVALAAVTTREGILLSRPEQMWADRLVLAAGERRSFAGSLKLVGEDEGERLLIVVCAGSEIGEASLREALPAEGKTVALASLPSNCGAEEFPLRGHK